MAVDCQVRQKRATVACLSCRKRKVRCDVEHKGLPCPQCLSEGFECALSEPTHKRSVELLTPADLQFAQILLQPPHPFPEPISEIQGSNKEHFHGDN